MEFGYSSEMDDENMMPTANVSHNVVKIKVFGVGGGGCNAVNRLAKAKIKDVEFIASNTDMMALNFSNSEDVKITKIQLGEKCTRGWGAGGVPEVGEQAALESKDKIRSALEGSNLVFVTAGMGGGTGTGGAPIVASIAKELGILTIAVVTKPMSFEGRRKMLLAEEGIEKLKKDCDVLVVIPNENAFEYVPKNTPYIKVMQIADDVLHNCILGITDIVVNPTLINLDFADLSTVIRNKGTAHIGIGRAKGENRVMEALRMAAMSPLLESNISGAKQVIVSVTGDLNMSAVMVQEALNLLSRVVSPDANIIQGLGIDANLKDEAIITIIATGFGGDDDGYVGGQVMPEPQKQEITPENFFTMPKPSDAKPEQVFDEKYYGKPYDIPSEKSKKPDIERETYSTKKDDDDVPSFIKRLRDRGNR